MSKYSAVKHLTKEDIIKNGSIFTPKCLTDAVRSLVRPYINQQSCILDLGSGYGAFISAFRNLGCSKIIGTDCDDMSVQFLKQEFPKIPFYCENSLLDIGRKKYGISENEQLIVVGNPPYNDVTSIYQKGKKGTFECDEDVMSRDIGIAFLKAYDKLQADYICVLHPLSYLIKQQNFKSLKSFREHYKLVDGIVFSSCEFETIQKNNSEFPVIAALYQRCANGMEYSDIQTFKFRILHSKKHFCLNRIDTIDGKMNKYPTKGSSEVLQFYTQRDMNSLMRNKAFVNGPIPNGIDVSMQTLYRYSWLLFLKQNFRPDKLKFIYGNLSPLYSAKIEKPKIKNLLVYYAYENDEIVHQLDVSALEEEYGPRPSNYSDLYNILKTLYI